MPRINWDNDRVYEAAPIDTSQIREWSPSERIERYCQHLGGILNSEYFTEGNEFVTYRGNQLYGERTTTRNEFEVVGMPQRDARRLENKKRWGEIMKKWFELADEWYKKMGFEFNPKENWKKFVNEIKKVYNICGINWKTLDYLETKRKLFGGVIFEDCFEIKPIEIKENK